MKHMVAATETIADYVARGRNVFENDSALRDAIVYQIIILGEAAKAVVMADDKIPTDVPEIEWSPWARMRDKVTHQYWATDREIVWSTAQSDVPKLRQQLQDAIKRLAAKRIKRP